MMYQMVQLHAAGGPAERAGDGRGAHRLETEAGPATHGGGALGRSERREAPAGGEAARGAEAAGGGGGGGGGAGGVGPRPRARLVHAPARPRPAATAASLQRSLLGLQAAPGLVRLPRHLLVLYIVTRPYG